MKKYRAEIIFLSIVAIVMLALLLKKDEIPKQNINHNNYAEKGSFYATTEHR